MTFDDMNCPQCNKPNREQASYCKWCGSKLQNKSADWYADLIGMTEAKQTLNDIITTNDALRLRASVNGIRLSQELNMLILGDSGTGKKTLLHKIELLFYQHGITTKPQATVVDASVFNEFVKDFDNNIMNARGGILCIQNAQKLLPDNEIRQLTDLDILFNAMDRFNGNPIVILMGTESGLDKFVANNQEVSDKFKYILHMKSYSISELTELTELLLRKNYALQLTSEAKEKLERVYKYSFRESPTMNISATIAKNKAEDIMRTVVQRDTNANTVLPCDIQGKEYIRKTTEQALAEFDDYVGIDNIKLTVQNIINELDLSARREGNEAKRVITDHFLFLGNPGTGKTSIARVFANVLCSVEALPIGQLVEVSRDQLVAQYLGQTAPLVRHWVDKAMGGVLFIDEAYTLKQSENDNFGQEAIDALLKLMEDRRGQFVVIAAGYTKEMGEFISSNSGLASRFNKTITFNDYTASQLTEIFLRLVKKDKLTLTNEAKERIENFFRKIYLTRTDKFGNAREVRNVLKNAKTNQSNRINEAKRMGTYTPSMDNYLTAEDIEGAEQMKEKNINELLQEIDAFVGMDDVKKQIREIALKVQQDKKRQALGADAEITPIHIVLTGNPGTGKTTVAKMLGKVFKSIDLLPDSKVVKKERCDLISNYKNETAKLVNKACDEAMGGVLFIDEAYSLMPIDAGGGKDPDGVEAVEALMTRMVSDSGKFVVIVAGYKQQMMEFIKNANPGFKRRFTNFMHIDDYTPQQLEQIFLNIVKKNAWEIAPQAMPLLKQLIQHKYDSRDENFGNAGEMDTLFGTIKMRQSARTNKIPNEQLDLKTLRTIEAEDIPYEQPRQVNITDCLKQLDNLVGLENVKSEVRMLAQSIIVQQQRNKVLGRPYKAELDHFLFLGNSGTGKTTVARTMADIFFSLGLLPTNTLIEVKRKDIVAGYQGHTAINTERVVKKAIGGVLFIDEAYSLKQGPHDDFGQEAINTLLTMLLDYKGKIVCIAAGYTREMNQWLASNSGLASRFSKTITFDDYNPDELADIFIRLAQKEELTLTPQAEECMRRHFTLLYQNRNANFGNAREVNNFFKLVKERQSARLTPATLNNTVTKEQLLTLEAEDFIV